MPKRGRKLIVVSNRGPYRRASIRGNERWVRSAGGLVSALDPVLQQRGGVWVSAKEAEDFDTVTVPGPRIEYDLAYISLRKADQRGFYEGVSNAVIWPLLHGFPPTIRVGDAPWNTYINANAEFADVVLQSGRSNDLVWVQDYHLMLVPGMLRAKRSKARIGWFCHVPWPSPGTFGILPWREQLLDGLLGADVLGFHIKEYVDNFLQCVERYTPYQVSKGEVQFRGRSVRVIAAPIGIPVQELQTLSIDPDVEAEAFRIRDTVGNRKIILGVDRLDYTKGIPERLLAFEGLLRKERNAQKKYVLIQVMVPSRTDVQAYADLKEEVDRMVGDINGRYSDSGRIPIHYLYRNLSQRALFAHYRAADVALITPLRDGMNLVAHEYVASRSNDDGVLVLSEFAGAAEHLKQALLVNAYDVNAVTAAIGEAVNMPLEEQTKRMKALRSEVRKLDVHKWADQYVRDLEGQ